MAINRKSFERVAFFTPTAGTGPFEVGTVVSSTMFLPSEVGMVDTDRVGYLIVGSGDVELGWTEASAGVTEFSRNVVRSKIGGVVSTSAKMDLQGTETVRFVDLSDIMIAAANAFDSTTEDADDIDEGSTHLFLVSAERSKLGYITITGAVNLDNLNTRVAELDSAVILRGVWDASSGAFPGGGSAQAGDSYIVDVEGTVNSITFNVGDRLIAITDNASTTTFAGNWFKADYTDQVSSVVGLTGAISASSLADALKTSAVGYWGGVSDVAFPTPKTIADAAEPQTLTDQATIAWDISAGGNAKVTLGGDRTLGTPTNPRRGMTYVLEVTQDGTGGRTLAFPSSTYFDWGSSGAQTITSTANKTSILTLYCLNASTPLFRVAMNKG